MMTTLCFLLVTGLSGLTLDQAPGQADPGCLEIHGVAAGEFNEAHWRDSTLHFLRDLRHPLLAPRQGGGYRNIYAPSALPVDGGWILFYGAWDGVRTGNDRIYAVDTPDFVDFGARRTVIEHGPFTHVCNVNAQRAPGGGYELMCTAYPDAKDLNKPAFFALPKLDQAAPRVAAHGDIVRVTGYDPYDDADINGVNVLLREGETRHLYFSSYKDFGKVYHAVGTDGMTYALKGVALAQRLAVNDVKRLETPAGPRYLMGLHMNREALWYSLGETPDAFADPVEFLKNAGPEDRYIVALGWVVRDNRVLGVLYGAGAVPELNRNRIFARWLQKKVVFTSEDGTVCAPEGAIGPDRQILRIPEGVSPKGSVQVFAEDGVTPLGPALEGEFNSPAIYQITLN